MSMFGFHRHSLSLKLGVTITAFIALLFISSVGLLYIRSRQLVKQEALERAEKALDKTALRVSCYLSEIEAVTENLKWIVNQDQTPDSLLAYTRRIVALSTNIDGCSITMEPDFYPPSVGRFSAYTVRKGDSIITQREGDYDYYSKAWYRTASSCNATTVCQTSAANPATCSRRLCIRRDGASPSSAPSAISWAVTKSWDTSSSPC